jgi:hypothetical protein
MTAENPCSAIGKRYEVSFINILVLTAVEELGSNISV